MKKIAITMEVAYEKNITFSHGWHLVVCSYFVLHKYSISNKPSSCAFDYAFTAVFGSPVELKKTTCQRKNSKKVSEAKKF
jgi:hypothetical protein